MVQLWFTAWQAAQLTESKAYWMLWSAAVPVFMTEGASDLAQTLGLGFGFVFVFQ